MADTRKLKNGDLRRYCYECGTRLCDQHTVDSGIKVFGLSVGESTFINVVTPYQWCATFRTERGRREGRRGGMVMVCKACADKIKKRTGEEHI